MRNKGINEAQFFSLLQKVLPATVQDPQLANAIYEGVVKEVQMAKNIASFEKFCEEGGLPDLEPGTVSEFQTELAGRFGEENVELTPDEDGKAVAVEIALPDREPVSTRVKVDPSFAQEEEPKAPFVPFPVVLPDDPELVWVLARRENVGPEEAGLALARIEEEFWETKKGQQLQRDRVEKCFAEFITHVPAAMLTESGLKRHYKEPEALRTLRLIVPKPGELAEAGI